MQPIKDDNVPGAWRLVCMVQSRILRFVVVQTLVDGAAEFEIESFWIGEPVEFVEHCLGKHWPSLEVAEPVGRLLACRTDCRRSY